MRKIISLISLILIIANITSPVIAAGDNEESNWYFVVTAYYSPLPDQKYYYTGNYESEVRLNGHWTHWASWKEVFSWMLAAPKTYEFWTKIYLEWLWVWEVSDRWGAIVSAWNRGYKHDRIDLWVWYWDEWLARALYWWKRTIKWYIVHESQTPTLDISKIEAPDWAVEWLATNTPTIFDTSIWKESSESDIIKLQEFFKEIELYNWEINWKYNSEIIDIIFNFQIENWILKEATDPWAWYWGQLTRESFKKAYLNGEFDQEETILEDEIKNTEELEEKNIEEEIIIPMAEFNPLVFERALNYSAEHVREVQSIMKELWLYQWAINGVSKELTNPIYNYQLSKGIATSWSSPWAWQYGPITREALKNDYLEHLEKKAIEEKIKQEEEYARQEEQKRIEAEQKQKEADEKRKLELQEKYEKIKMEAIEKAVKEIEVVHKVKFWDSSEPVREFQIFLKDMWYFTAKDTWNFWEQTKLALMNFQVDYWIINSKNDLWAWEMTDDTIFMIVNIRARWYIKELIHTNPERDLVMFIQ